MVTKNRVLFYFAVLFTQSVWAQQSPLLTQFSVDQSLFNPAFSGVEEFSKVSVFHRSQWLGYNDFNEAYGAPSTQYAGLQVPLRLEHLNMGTGLSIFRDNLGPISTYDTRLNISWIKNYHGLRWSVGIQPSFKSTNLNTSALDPINPQDPTLIGLSEFSAINNNAFDLNLGIAVKSEKLVLGLSMINLLESNMNFLSSVGQLEQELNFYANYDINVAYKIDAKPFVLIRTDLTTASFDIGALATYDDLYTVGLSYRNEESISVLMNGKKSSSSDLMIGLALDFVISNTADKQFSTFEMMISYDIRNFILGKRKIIRTPRFRY